MAMKDEFGYPLEIDAVCPYMPPVELPPWASPEEHDRHADAYSDYQERFLQAFKERRENME